MLSLYRSNGETQTLNDLAEASLPSEAVWLDLLSASPEEVGFVERTTGLRLPGFDDLLEIEASSRLYVENGTLFMSVPLVYRPDGTTATVTPVGFVLNRHRLVTIRFATLPSFATFQQTCTLRDDAHATGAAVFAGLSEAIVDRLADVLELIAADLDALSQRLFRPGPGDRRHRPARAEANLRAALQQVGSNGDHASQIRDSLLGIARIAPFVANHGADWVSPDVRPRLETLRQDVASLSDYNAHLVNKIQLLLDATLGLINIEQNNIIKVLTIVSVVGVPPTLVASMYGMNFKGMPELDWAWGYPYGLTMIFLSAVLPLVWFRMRGWF